MNEMLSNVMNPEEVESAQRREKARRTGHDFIRLIYKGSIYPPPRVSSVQDIVPYDIPDPDSPGETKTLTRKGTAEVEWERDTITGDHYYYILDCSYNRYWIKSFLYPKSRDVAVEVDDRKIRAEIEALDSRNFQASYGRKQEIEDQMRELKRELASLPTDKNTPSQDAPVADIQKKPATRRVSTRKRKRPKVKRDINGNDLPTLDVDRTGTSRVEPGGSEGHTPAV